MRSIRSSGRESALPGQQFSRRFWYRPSDVASCFEPEADRRLRFRQCFFVRVPMRGASQQLGNISDEHFVFIAPEDGDLVLVHGSSESGKNGCPGRT